MIRRRHLLAAAAACIAAPARAQSPWPTRPIRFILPDAPGAGNDTTARLVAPPLEAALGQPIVVDNRAGAGGRIGVEAAFRSAPDGYTFLLGNAGSNGINAAIYRDLPYDLTNAFEPVSLLVVGPNALIVNPRALPVASVAELIATVRARPGGLNYASAGVGSSAHMNMELFKNQAGLDIVHVPYRGAPALVQAVITGEAPLAFANLVNVMPQVRSGEVKLLAVTSMSRTDDLPQTPTVHESGLPGFESVAWNGLLAPRGTPATVLERLHGELVKLRGNADLQARVRLLGGTLQVSSPAEFQQRIERDVAQWKRLAQAANISAQ
ncbi:tripartite tricarboxylate transporter substrate binding protein [Roseomonas sp. PWR1]|uniref:Tripartite tricarboxylate transporter substrate binding protein n=1 Tax=Roseomonas nitratireducens TaxID=2820810 RepID=A0ABS4AMJ5_9PROT|nr:tripartite tricarboxylate transporter substrate binding protein [Neoroseomonas nitratireducens]MBP0462546.1 tripartite tricarboxylate transporter substrate binding protein [Neoroseomonas nitratireducens]